MSAWSRGIALLAYIIARDGPAVAPLIEKLERELTKMRGSRATSAFQPLATEKRSAFLRELEGRLKEQAAVLDAHKPSRRSPSRLPELFDSPALLFRRSVNPKVVQLLPGAKLRH